jgi:hypothetical protein
MNFEETVMWNRLSGTPENYYTEAAEPEREAFRVFLRSLLHDGKVTVEFTKSDGSTRVMNCTLNEEFGAKYSATEKVVEGVDRKPKKVNPDVCAVWDCEANAWRSFRWDRLKQIDFKIG